MDHLAEIGDQVVYNGETKHATDESTLRLMRNNLKIGEMYTVRGISMYNGYLAWHYQFMEAGPTGWNGWHYPYKSFNLGFTYDYITQKYDLK